MRKLMFALVLAVSVQSFVAAQNRGGYGQPVSVTGTLGLQHGHITVSGDGTAYYVPVLERYIGFIEGLKDGVRISLEGYVLGNGDYAQIRPVKVTIDGKDYDFSPRVPPMPYHNNRRHGNGGRGYGDGYGGHGWGGQSRNGGRW
jgi:hypothetical protein